MKITKCQNYRPTFAAEVEHFNISEIKNKPEWKKQARIIRKFINKDLQSIGDKDTRYSFRIIHPEENIDPFLEITCSQLFPSTESKFFGKKTPVGKLINKLGTKHANDVNLLNMGQITRKNLKSLAIRLYRDCLSDKKASEQYNDSYIVVKPIIGRSKFWHFLKKIANEL